jgi:transposase
MAKKTKSKAKGSCRMLPVMHPDAAGVDIGAEEIFVAVPADRDVESVRSFDTFTRDLHQLADWLQSCRVRTVAMESTGVSRFLGCITWSLADHGNPSPSVRCGLPTNRK